MTIKKIFLFATLCSLCMSAVADLVQSDQEAPVVTAEQYTEPNSPQTISTDSLSIEQRMSRLERLVNNQNGYAAQIQNLQHQVQELQGRLEEANHQIQILQQANNSNTSSIVNKSDTKETMPAQPATTSPISTSSNLLQEQDIYEKAYQLMQKREYAQAIAAMRSYIEQFPRGQYTGNAHYWLGEIYVLQHKSENARSEFKIVVDKFSDNAKAQLAAKRLREIDVKSNAKP